MNPARQHGATGGRFGYAAQEHPDHQRQRHAADVGELGTDDKAARNSIENVAEYDRKARTLAGLG